MEEDKEFPGYTNRPSIDKPTVIERVSRAVQKLNDRDD